MSELLNKKYSSSEIARLKGLDKSESFAIIKIFPTECFTIEVWETKIKDFNIK